MVNEPILSKDLKKLGNYRKGGRKGFDTIITRLQAQCYVLISDFVYEKEVSFILSSIRHWPEGTMPTKADSREN